MIMIWWSSRIEEAISNTWSRMKVAVPSFLMGGHRCTIAFMMTSSRIPISFALGISWHLLASLGVSWHLLASLGMGQTNPKVLGLLWMGPGTSTEAIRMWQQGIVFELWICITVVCGLLSGYVSLLWVPPSSTDRCPYIRLAREAARYSAGHQHWVPGLWSAKLGCS